MDSSARGEISRYTMAILRDILLYLRSVRCTLHVILALLAVFLFGFLVPQKSVMGREAYLQWQVTSPRLLAFCEESGLLDIFASPVTLGLWGLFFTNLALVMYHRLPALRAKTALNDRRLVEPAAAKGYPAKKAVEVPDSFPQAELPLLLAHRGYKFYGSPNFFYAVRNRFSPYANLLFHCSFLVILLGAVCLYYTRFSGFVELTEKESFGGEIGRYKGQPRLPRFGGPPVTSITLETVVPETKRGVATGLTAIVRDAGGTLRHAEINHPYREGNVSFVVSNLGVSPLFVLKDAAGREVDGAYVKLDLLGGKEDRFVLAGYSVRVRLGPGYAIGSREPGGGRSKGTLDVIVERDGIPQWRGTVHEGGGAPLGGATLEFRENPLWVRFLVVKEEGLEFVYGGFFLAIVALFWRFGFFRREIVGAFGEEGGKSVIRLAGRAEFYPLAAQDEVNRIAAAIEEEARSRYHCP